ncbi:MAG TPA: Maf family protein [Sphingomicrobium sp.]|nr:Maf family protein [Sphingomicrobium sp.]
MALILASASAIRRSMLEQAGVEFVIQPGTVDETEEKRNHSDPVQLASALAEAKALSVSRDRLDEWVIGSDSVVSVCGRRFDKPSDWGEAAEHLRFFSGKEMVLTSAVALAHNGVADWLHCDSAHLKVRPLSERFIERYLDAEWPEVGYCVGVFRLEGPGVQLFEAIDGSYFTILGMPLLPLLEALRERGLLLS